MNIANFKATFGARLRTLRNQASLKQQELAKKVDLKNAATISLWENGNALPSLEQLFKLAQTFQVPLEYLLDLTSTTPLQRYAGFEWVVSRPHPDSPYATPELDEGITLFELLVKHGLSTREIQQAYPEFSRYSENALVQLLKHALHSHSIQVVNVQRDHDLEKQLQGKFNLKGCIVADLNELQSDYLIDRALRTEAIAFLASRDAIPQIEGFKSVGMLGGTIISRVVDQLQPISHKLQGITWVSMVATAGIQAPIGMTANGVVERIVYTQPGATGYILPFIDASRRSEDFYRTAVGQERDELEKARLVLWYAQNVQAVLMSVGALMNLNPLGVPLAKVLQTMSVQDRERAAGDVMLRLVNQEGQRVGTQQNQADNDASVYSISLEELRAICSKGMVWIVAGEVRKAPVIRGALLSGYANSLVIETTIAEALLADP